MLGQQGERITRIEGQLDQQGERITRMEGRLERIEGQLNQQGERIARMEGRLDEQSRILAALIPTSLAAVPGKKTA